MGRKINNSWFGHYRIATQALTTALAAGEHRADVLARHAIAAGIKEQSFTRLMKAGRFLDAQIPALSPEDVLCSYVQVDLLEKIFRIDPQQGMEKLSGVIANRISPIELEMFFKQLKLQHPVAEAIVGRDNMRQATTTHERLCSQAIGTAGPAFFGAPRGRILKQSQASLYTSPQFIVTQDGQPLAAIFPRVGGSSKPPMAIALELFQLALAHRALTPDIWFIFPRCSTITTCLAALAFELEAAPDGENWLHIATLGEEAGALQALGSLMYRGSHLELALEGGIDTTLTWHGKDLATGQEETLNYHEALQPKADARQHPAR